MILNDLTGLGDQTFVSLYTTAQTKEQQVLQLGHEMRLGSEGLTLSGRFSYAWTRPALPAAPDVLKARTLFATGEARYPFRRTEALSIWGAGGVDFVDQVVRFGGVPIARDNLRTGFLRVDLSAVDTGPTPAWQLIGSAELRKGLDVFDASPRPSLLVPTMTTRLDGDPRAALFRFQGSGEFRLTPTVTGALAIRGQYAFDPVLSFEEFAAGSYSIGRGYDPGTLLGDSGLGLSAEVRLNSWTPSGPRLVLQPFVFGDAARVWSKNGLGTDRLISVGGGVRASLDNRYRLDLTVAVPTEKAGFLTRRGDPRILLSFTTRLWPWGN